MKTNSQLHTDLQGIVSFNIRMHMAARKLNQQQIADALGISRPAVS